MEQKNLSRWQMIGAMAIFGYYPRYRHFFRRNFSVAGGSGLYLCGRLYDHYKKAPPPAKCREGAFAASALRRRYGHQLDLTF